MNPVGGRDVRNSHSMRSSEGTTVPTESGRDSLDANRDKLEVLLGERRQRPSDFSHEPVCVLLSPRFRSMLMSPARDLQAGDDPCFLRQAAFDEDVGDVDTECNGAEDRSDLHPAVSMAPTDGRRKKAYPECPVPLSGRVGDRDGGQVSAEVEDAAHGDVETVDL
jgi:hypothetical protein